MTNTLLTPQMVATQALANLYNALVMRQLVYTDVSSNFVGAKIGDTINIRQPTVFTAEPFIPNSTGIVIQNATENAIPVVLNKHFDTSFAVSSKDLTLNIVNFGEQFLTPAMMALAEQIDQSILSLRSSVTNTVGTTTGLEWSKPNSLIDAGRVLDLKAVPGPDRNVVMGPTTKANWLQSPLLQQVLQSGNTDALRLASVGQNIFGMNAYITQNVGQPPADTAAGLPTTEQSIAFHKTAFCFASAPLELPMGAIAASVEYYDGLSIRVVYAYDNNQKQMVCSLDVLYGVTTLDANRACIIQGALTGS